MTLVNKYLKEPMLCHDATDTALPQLLIQMYQDRTEALCVVLHVLMLETGYTTYDIQSGAVNLKDCHKSFPGTWKHSGCYKFQYTYSGCEEGTVSHTVIPAGNLVVLHGKVNSPSVVQSWQCKLKVDDFVRCVTSGVGKPEIYGFLGLTQEVKLYKEQYKLRKEHKKRLKKMMFIVPPTFQPIPTLFFPGPLRPPGPGFIGGDYDLFPNFSGPSPLLPRPRFDPMGPLPGMFPGPGRRGGFGGMGPRFF